MFMRHQKSQGTRPGHPPLKTKGDQDVKVILQDQIAEARLNIARAKIHIALLDETAHWQECRARLEGAIDDIRIAIESGDRAVTRGRERGVNDDEKVLAWNPA